MHSILPTVRSSAVRIEKYGGSSSRYLGGSSAGRRSFHRAGALRIAEPARKSSGAPLTVNGDLLYYSHPPDGSRPYTLINADPKSGRTGNWIPEHHEVEIQDLRGRENSVSLDTAGFQFYQGAPDHTSFTDEEEIRGKYYPESVALVKLLTGANRAVPFDHTIRRRRPGELDDSPEKRQPVPQVHVDQTPQSSVARVHRHLPASDVPGLLQRRFQILNLWRPLDHPALDWPLALCDYGSINRKQDVIPITLRYPDHEGETYGVKYSPEHRWRYLKAMRPDEFVLIKCFDSQDDGKTAVFTPHTAFDDPTTPKDAPFRESVELRMLVFY